MKAVIPPQFESARGFEHGMAIVEKNNRWGVIDTLGKVLIPIEYEWIGRVKDDYFEAQKEDRRDWLLIRKGGKILYDGISGIDTLRGNKLLITIGHRITGRDTLKYALIDSAGTIVIDSADKIFPVSTGAVYLKNGSYYKYGLSEEDLFKALSASLTRGGRRTERQLR